MFIMAIWKKHIKKIKIFIKIQLLISFIGIIHPNKMYWEGHMTFLIFLPKMYHINPVMRKHQTIQPEGFSEKQKQRQKQQKNNNNKKTWPVPLKDENVLKDKKRLKDATKCRRLRRHENYAKCTILIEFIKRKDINEKKGKNYLNTNKACCLVNYIVLISYAHIYTYVLVGDLLCYFYNG